MFLKLFKKVFAYFGYRIYKLNSESTREGGITPADLERFKNAIDTLKRYHGRK